MSYYNYITKQLPNFTLSRVKLDLFLSIPIH